MDLIIVSHSLDVSYSSSGSIIVLVHYCTSRDSKKVPRIF
jgi:hypothetical protein